MKRNTILLAVVVAVLAIGTVKASIAEEPTQEATSEPTVEETTEVTQVTTETEPTVTEPPEATEDTYGTEPTETEPQTILYDVPLSEDFQLYIIGLCENHHIDPAIVMAMIWRESRFNASSVGDNGNSLGLMQIQPRWHQNRMDALGCPDLLDPYQNVTVGINILASHLERWEGNIEMAIVSYNAGATGAYNKYFSKGIYSSKYSEAVLAKAEEIRSGSYVYG